MALGLAVDLKPPLTCVHCGERAVCVGHYEGGDEHPSPACSDCCAHGNEDGWCHQIMLEVHTGSQATWHRWTCSCGKESKTWTTEETAASRGRTHLATHLKGRVLA